MSTDNDDDSERLAWYGSRLRIATRFNYRRLYYVRVYLSSTTQESVDPVDANDRKIDTSATCSK